eukprot:2830090-Pyramimonas_sp.AAC.1
MLAEQGGRGRIQGQLLACRTGEGTKRLSKRHAQGEGGLQQDAHARAYARSSPANFDSVKHVVIHAIR